MFFTRKANLKSAFLEISGLFTALRTSVRSAHSGKSFQIRMGSAMRLFYEIVMGVTFLLPLPAMLLRMIRGDMDAHTIEEYRFFSAACAIGFLLGAIARWMAHEIWLVPLLYALGFLCAVAAFLYTLNARKRRPHERR